jgi:1,2-diacylglycerol 3-alpha-glucosyltransferase
MTASFANPPYPSRVPASAAEEPTPSQNIGILNDYLKVPYANGSSFASQMLYREFTRRGHTATVIGPRDPSARPEQLPDRYIELPSAPFRVHPGVHLPLPGPKALARVADARFDVMLGQTGSRLLDLGIWLRQRHKVPMLCVNTVHLPSVVNVILPEALQRHEGLQSLLSERVLPWAERKSAESYNRTDGLIVLSRGLERYWRERGVTCPISVIPRSVDPNVFDAKVGPDPFPAWMKRGYRMLVVCRHTQEKELERLLDIFAELIFPACPEATLTLIGDGPDHEAFKLHAERLGVGERTLFVGEKPLTEVPTWYRNADVFVYTSLSETYGQVISEALWCGLPVVAFADDKGVSEQIHDGQTGYLIPLGKQPAEANWRFANSVLRLLRAPALRAEVAHQAESLTRRLRDPERGVQRYFEAFEEAKEHLRATHVERGPGYALGPLLNWSVVHALLGIGGCLRPPSKMDLGRIRQPAWRERELVIERSRIESQVYAMQPAE